MLDEYVLDISDIFKKTYKPFPDITNRDVWDSINPLIKANIISIANKYLNKQFNIISASLWLEYEKTGNRLNFQNEFASRRKALNYLLLAILITNDDIYLDKIIDLTWMLLEETSWTIPAHNTTINGLPDANNHIIALFSAETGMTLSLIKYFLKEKLNEKSPVICKRITQTLNTRLLTPYIENSNYWWMGFKQVKNEKLNNWNPWINSNILLISLLSDLSINKKGILLKKLIASLDLYISAYSNDGCCDEGPGYWKRSGASMLECLVILQQITNNKLNVFDNNKIKKIGQYILNSHIDKKYMTNYADASGKVELPANLIYKYGKSISDTNLMAFASYLLKLNNNILQVEAYGLPRILDSLLNFDNILRHNDNFTPCKEHYYEDIQIFIKRTKSLFFTAKGGYNNENHNHNDIGSFMIYKNGLPLIIDIGAQVYTRDSFSDKRYDIWLHQSAFHNSVTIDNIMQSNGNQYKATSVKYIKENTFSEFSFNIEKAYNNPNILSLHRKFIIENKSENITVYDNIHLNKKSNNILYTFITPTKPTIENNIVTFINTTEKLSLSIDENITITLEEIPIDDEHLNKAWNNRIYRVLIKLNKPFISKVIKLTFKNT